MSGCTLSIFFVFVIFSVWCLAIIGVLSLFYCNFSICFQFFEKGFEYELLFYLFTAIFMHILSMTSCAEPCSDKIPWANQAGIGVSIQKWPSIQCLPWSRHAPLNDQTQILFILLRMGQRLGWSRHTTRTTKTSQTLRRQVTGATAAEGKKKEVK